MQYQIKVGDEIFTLEHGQIDEVVNVDDLTRIDTSNLFGEAVTVSAAANRIGLMKAEVEATLADLRLEIKIYEKEYTTRLRIEATRNSGTYNIAKEGEDPSYIKLTEKALESCYESDDKWIDLMMELNQAEKNFNSLSVLYWSIQDKCRKLNGLVSSTTPDDFIAGVIEGKINGMLITKGSKSEKAGSIK